ncbi:MAG: nuclear transport factor 2 family protein [Geminicoccaceae bacterium]
MDDREVGTVLDWHDALNEGDVEHLVELSSDDIEVGGPRGPSRGVQVLREWVERANIRLEPRQVFRRGQTVVVEQDALWRSPDTGEVIGSEVVASVFVIQSGRVVSVHRHPDLATALNAAGLGEADRV